MSKLINISELSKMLNLIDSKTKKPANHVLRYWEKEFKEIKPKKINKRRYYSSKQIEKIKFIKFLLKNKGMSIMGAKKMLNLNRNKLDDYQSDSLKAEYYKENIKLKSKLLLNKINKIKKNGKKTHLKVRMVPESNPDSKFIYYAKKPTKGEKAKDKLKLKNIILIHESTNISLKKNYLHIVNNYFFKISVFVINKRFNHSFPYFVSYFRVYFPFF